MVRADQRDHISPETRRHDIEQRGQTPKNAPTNRAAYIDEEVYKVPTRDHGRLKTANAATATGNIATAPEVVSLKSDGAIAVEIDA